jgi:hypothetical protein
MSAADMCPKRMDYEVQRGPKEPDHHQLLRMLRGNHLHNMWQEIMADAFDGDYVTPEKEVTIALDESITVPGHCDGYIKSLDAVYELKTVNPFTFKTIVNNDMPLRYNMEQANLYAWAYPAKHILFHYFDVAFCDSRFYLVPVSKHLLDLTVAKFKGRMANRVLGEMIDRPYHDPTGEPCSFCPWSDECYEGFAGQINAMSPAVLDVNAHADLYEHCVSSSEAREQRLEMDKIEKQSKKLISEYMLGGGWADAELGPFKIKVKLGKNNNPIVDVKGAAL